MSDADVVEKNDEIPPIVQEKISFEELNRETMIAREEKKIKSQERFNIAYAEARDIIVKNYTDKLKEAASQGRTQATLYEFEWIQEKDSNHDGNGIQTVFHGGVRLLDILTKGWKIFKNMLEEYFNEGEELKPYHCGYYKKFDESRNMTKWFIFINWDTNKKEYKYDEHRSSHKNTGRGYGGRGNYNGRGGGRGFGRSSERTSSTRESL